MKLVCFTVGDVKDPGETYLLSYACSGFPGSVDHNVVPDMEYSVHKPPESATCFTGGAFIEPPFSEPSPASIRITPRFGKKGKTESSSVRENGHASSVAYCQGYLERRRRVGT